MNTKGIADLRKLVSTKFSQRNPSMRNHKKEIVTKINVKKEKGCDTQRKVPYQGMFFPVLGILANGG